MSVAWDRLEPIERAQLISCRPDLKKWKFKACPKCRGDLHLGHDGWEDYYECLQCGYSDYDSQPLGFVGGKLGHGWHRRK